MGMRERYPMEDTIGSFPKDRGGETKSKRKSKSKLTDG